MENINTVLSKGANSATNKINELEQLEDRLRTVARKNPLRSQAINLINSDIRLQSVSNIFCNQLIKGDQNDTTPNSIVNGFINL